MSILFSLWTVFVALIFFGVVFWVLRGDKSQFDEAGRIPLEEEDELPVVEEKNHG